MQISKGRGDEVFVLRDLGVAVRIYELIDVINAIDDLEALWYPTAELIGIRQVERLDRSFIETMPNRRRDEPVIICEVLGEIWLIDGNHRLEKRCRDRLPETQAIEIPGPVLADFIDDVRL